MALHHAVALCMEHCQDAELTGDDSWFRTVVLAGGSACLPGLAGERKLLQDSFVLWAFQVQEILKESLCLCYEDVYCFHFLFQKD